MPFRRLQSWLRQRGEPPSPLIPVQTTGTQPPFFFVHGGKTSQARLSEYLGPDQPLYGLAQHFDGQRICFTTIPDIAAFYVEALRSVQPVGPYFLGGHSLGGVIAFEMALQLRRSGQEIALLVLVDSGTRQIGIFETEKPAPVSFAWRSWIRHQHSRVHARLREFRTAVAHLPKTLRCHAYHGLRRPLPRALIPFYINHMVFEARYFKSLAYYVPEVYAGSLVYLKSEEPGDREAVWRRYVTGRVEVRPVPGQHLTMLKEPHLLRLAETLREILTRAQAERGRTCPR